MQQFTYGTTYCQSCGHDVALNAIICPRCGNHQPGKWDLDGLKSAGLLIVILFFAVIGMFPLLPVLLGLLVGLAPFVLIYAIIKANGQDDGEAGGHGKAPYSCLRCSGGMSSINGVCPSCGFGANEMVCSCGLEVIQPHERAFEETGVICPNCNGLLRR